MNPVSELPDDPSLPAIVAIRRAGVAAALPVLDLQGRPVALKVVGYTQGSRATLEVRSGRRRVAVKAYAADVAPEAMLYTKLAAAGLAADEGPRVPPLLAWDAALKVMVLGWLEGPSAHQLVKEGQGERAGELAARWVARASSLRLNLGPVIGPPDVLRRAEKWASRLQSADPGLGIAAAALRGALARAQPTAQVLSLVHGTFYDRHIFDLGNGPGVIDWQRFGQGPPEVDSAMFLATVSRVGRRHETSTDDAVKAADVFLRETAGILDERRFAWYRAAALLRLAARLLNRRPRDWRARAEVMLGEAERFVAAD